MTVGVDEKLEVMLELVVAVAVLASDGRILDRAVHSFDLIVGPGVVRPGQPMFDAMFTADLVEAMDPHPRGPSVAVLGQVGELDAFRGQQ